MTRYYSLTIICLFLIAAAPPARAQSDSTRIHRSLKSILTHDGTAFFQDAVDLAKSPGHFSGRDWLYIGAVVGGTALLFSVDEPVRDMAQRQHGQILDDIARFSNVGVTQVEIEIGPIIWAGGLILRNESIRMAGLEMFESLTFAAILTNTLKVSFGRSRPYVDQGAFKYRPFHASMSGDWASMPSGHATAAFAMYSALAAHIHNTWASLGLYGLASVQGLARIYSDVHWTSDVFLGAAIGTVIGNAVVHMHENRKAASHWEVGLAPGGVRVALRF